MEAIMDYATRMGSGPRRAHVNYQCPCGCVGGVIYSSEKALPKAGSCCCGRKLWVGVDAETRIRSFLEDGVEYEWDVGSVVLPWGEVARTAMAWPRDSVPHAAAPSGAASSAQVTDVVCGMMIDPATAAAKSAYRGETYFFCAAVCKRRFDANPRRYAATGKGLLGRLRGRYTASEATDDK